MPDADTALQQLCETASPLIQPAVFARQQWVKEGTGYALITANDPVQARRVSIDTAFPAICRLREYHALHQLLAEDSVLGQVSAKGGRSVEELINHVLRAAVNDANPDVWSLHAGKACALLGVYREQLSLAEIECTCRARIYGLELSSEVIELPEQMSLRLLDEAEVDRNVYLTDLIGMNPEKWRDLNEQPVEVRGRVMMQMAQCQNFHNATHRAREHFRPRFADVISALRLVRFGSIELGPVSSAARLFFGGYLADAAKPRVYGPPVQIGSGDAREIAAAYALVSAVRQTDRVVERAIRSYISSRERPDLTDRLIDLVIGWESVLLTVAKNSPVGETTYRFSINGASVLRAAGLAKDPINACRFMRAAYQLRSALVHGAEQTRITDVLRKCGVDSLGALANTLDEHFRAVVLWLTSLPPADRPYHASDGWERLLWQ